MGHGLILRRKLVSEASLSPEPFTAPDNIRYCPSFRKDIPIPKVDHPCITHPFATLPGDCSPFTLDLHVLGTPPAFVLSQDQTLQIHFVPVFRDQGPLIGRCCSYLVVNDPRRSPCVSTGRLSLQGFFLPERVNRLILHFPIIPVNPSPAFPALLFSGLPEEASYSLLFLFCQAALDSIYSGDDLAERASRKRHGRARSSGTEELS